MGLLCADGRAEGPVYDPCIFYYLLEARMQQFDIIDAFIVRCKIPDCKNMIVKDCHWNFVARMTVHEAHNILYFAEGQSEALSLVSLSIS